MQFAQSAFLFSLAALVPQQSWAQPQPTPPGTPAPAQAAPADSSLADIQAALAADAAASSTNPAPPSTDSAPPPQPRSVQSLNPDLSVIGDFAFAAFSREQNRQTGGHDPTETGFNLQQLELALGAAVDPYFRFDSYLVFGPDGFELEEAYGTTLELPGRLQARVGQFLSRFGRQNSTHPHTWDFVDQPFALGRLFGADQNRGLGVELSYLTPLPWYVELVASLSRADGAGTARSFFGDTARPVKGPADLLLVSAIKQFFPLSSDWSLAWGLSSALGPNPSGLGYRTQVYGTDFYLKFRPITRQSQTQISLQTELFYRRRKLEQAELSDFNGYSSLVYRFAQHWSVAGRYEYGSPAYAGTESRIDPLDPEWTRARSRLSAAFTHYPTEFSRIRLQGSRDAGFAEPVWAGFLALELTIGAHGAHPF